MTRYVWNGDGFADPKTGEPMAKPYAGQVVLPQIRGDIPAYRSPVTGQMIEGRAARREDLKRSGCREVDPSEKPLEMSDKFARKLHDAKKRQGA